MQISDGAAISLKLAVICIHIHVRINTLSPII